MKKLMTVLAVAGLGLATVGLWAADAPPTTAPAPTAAPLEGPGGPDKMPGMHHHMGGPMGMMGMGHKMEKATFLGVGVSPSGPVLQAQLGLLKGSGMVVDFVEKDSPADKAGLKRYDILAKLNDQILFNMPQLSALVRTFKEGDAVSLTVIHEGKSTQVSATLAEKEQPVMGMGTMGMMMMHGMMPGMPGMQGMMQRMHPGMGGPGGPEGMQGHWRGGPDRAGQDEYKGHKGHDDKDDGDDDDDDKMDDHKPE